MSNTTGHGRANGNRGIIVGVPIVFPPAKLMSITERRTGGGMLKYREQYMGRGWPRKRWTRSTMRKQRKSIKKQRNEQSEQWQEQKLRPINICIKQWKHQMV